MIDNICKNCKYFNKRIVIQPSGFGMCQNGCEDRSPDWNDIYYPNYKRVLPLDFTCDKFINGQYQRRKRPVKKICKRLASQIPVITKSKKLEIAQVAF